MTQTVPASLNCHRVSAAAAADVSVGTVAWAPVKSLWFLTMLAGALIGLTMISAGAVALFLVTTACVLLFGHSLGSHRKLIHNSFQCPKWLENALVYLGVQVGLAGPIGLLRQHELRDYAQRLPHCHDYLRHGSSFWRDAWWQLNCELKLTNPPHMRIETRIADDKFFRLLERTWMAQQIPWALLFYVWGGWAFVCWGVCARVTAGVFGHWLIGYFAHNHGGMHYEVRGAAVQGRNIAFTSLLTMGECWHNNHHAFPGSARLGLFPGQWDPGWWMLMLLRRAGLVWGVRLAEHLPPRPELVPTRACARALASPPRMSGGTSRRFALLLGMCRSAPLYRSRLRLSGPASHLSPRATRWLIGRDDAFVHDASVRRLTLCIAQRRILGLPALLIALATRSPAARRAAVAAMPLAYAVERLRGLGRSLTVLVPLD